ncbi:MAG: hypothetical protein AB7U82_15355 [Blastocatellales bacterium]
MKKRLMIHLVLGCAVTISLLAQAGCSSKTDNTGSTAQPAASPNNAAALTSASPAADAASSAAGNPNAAGGGSAPGAPGGNLAGNAVAPTPAPTPRTFTIAAGTPIAIYTARTLSTKTDKDGERFVASLARPIVDDDWVIAKKGAQVEGVIVNSDPGGKVKGRALMTVRLSSLQLADGRTIDLSTSSYTKEAKGTKKKDAAKIGIGAGVGAAIGAIAGGGKGAAIGAGVGGGAGTGYVLATRGAPAVIPGESQLTFKLTAPITVTKR